MYRKLQQLKRHFKKHNGSQKCSEDKTDGHPTKKEILTDDTLSSSSKMSAVKESYPQGLETLSCTHSKSSSPVLPSLKSTMLQQEDFDLHTLSMEDDRPVHDLKHPSLSPRDEEFPTSCETSTKKSPTDGKSEKSHEVQHKESTTLSWLFNRLWPFSRRKSHIYLCTSMDPSTISGLKEHLKTICNPCRNILQEQELPHGGLDEFRLPPEASRRDAVILCHSVQNRGLAITDVENSIYEEFLEQCNAVFGKGHVCVIVHDFEFNSGALEGSRAILQTRQPMVFKMADLIILAGKLADGELQISQDEIKQLKNFITGIR